MRLELLRRHPDISGRNDSATRICGITSLDPGLGDRLGRVAGVRDAGQAARELPIRKSSQRERVGHVAGRAQSFRGARSETTGDELEASARKLTERSLLGAKWTGTSLPPVYCGASVGS